MDVEGLMLNLQRFTRKDRWDVMVDTAQKLLPQLTDEQRVQFWRAMQKGYCGLCGCNNPQCCCDSRYDE